MEKKTSLFATIPKQDLIPMLSDITNLHAKMVTRGKDECIRKAVSEYQGSPLLPEQDSLVKIVLIQNTKQEWVIFKEKAIGYLTTYCKSEESVTDFAKNQITIGISFFRQDNPQLDMQLATEKLAVEMAEAVLKENEQRLWDEVEDILNLTVLDFQARVIIKHLRDHGFKISK